MFAPGHLGELTQVVPFELADAVLADARAVQRRLRLLPSRVGIYFVLALGLFPQWGLPGCVGGADRGAGRAGPGRAVGRGRCGTCGGGWARRR